MHTQPDVKLFRPLDVLYWFLFCGVPTGLAIGAMLTPQKQPIVAWIILWAAVSGFWAVCILYFMKRQRLLQMLKFVTKQGITVGWEDSKYAVGPKDFEDQANALIAKLTARYKTPEHALNGCLVLMMTPSWGDVGPDFVARKVAGMQMGKLIYVGWREDLSRSALQHELGHRVIQFFDGDMPEAASHKILAEVGL